MSYWGYSVPVAEQRRLRKQEERIAELERQYKVTHALYKSAEAENKRLRDAIQIAISGGRPLGGQIDPEECRKNMLWVLEGALALNQVDTE